MAWRGKDVLGEARATARSGMAVARLGSRGRARSGFGQGVAMRGADRRGNARQGLLPCISFPFLRNPLQVVAVKLPDNQMQGFGVLIIQAGSLRVDLNGRPRYRAAFYAASGEVEKRGEPKIRA